MKATIFGYAGGTFSDTEVLEARSKGGPLTLDMAFGCHRPDIDLPGAERGCLLNCFYCGYRDTQQGQKMTAEEIKEVIWQFAELGGKSVKFLGEGEPFLRSDIFELLEFIYGQGMQPVLFDSGNELGSDGLVEAVHGMSSQQAVRQLKRYKTTVMLKYDLQNQDQVVGRKGYSERRKKTLNLLLKEEFNSFQPTCLGFGIVVLGEALAEIPANYAFALDHNIYPLLCPLMPAGKAKDPAFRAKIGIPPAQMVELAATLNLIAERKGIRIKKPADFLGGLPCDISRAGFYVADTGVIYVCESDAPVGNIRSDSLEKTWKLIRQIREKRRKTISWYPDDGECFPKRAEGILPTNFDEAVALKMEEYRKKGVGFPKHQ